jgi:hypothetical protein
VRVGFVPIAHGTGGPADVFTTAMLVVAGFTGWVGIRRLRSGLYERVPRVAAMALVGVAAVALVLAFVNPWFSSPAAARPSTDAKVEIENPTPGEVLHGDPAMVDVRIALPGGRVVPFTTRRLIPNAGHLHVYLDGTLVSMTQGLQQEIAVKPGAHRLAVEFVAVDHGPFNPPVLSEVLFRVEA